MAGFAANNYGAAAPALTSMTTTFKTLLNLSVSTATAARRIKIHEFVFGTTGTASDNVMQWDVSRSTAIGTGVAGTVLPYDPADSAFLGVSTLNHTVEPTIAVNVASLWTAGMNSRATHRWVAYPGQEFVIPATNLAGLAFRSLSPAYNLTASVQVEFVEQ